MYRPSGDQVTLRRGAAVATVVEVSGGLRSYDVGDRVVVDGFAEDEMASAGRGQVLLPWPNRIDGGTWTWQGKKQQLAVSEVSKNNAMHGLARWAGWRLEQDGDASVVTRYVVHPQSGYPFRIAAEVRYRLDDDGLTVTTRLENQTDVPAPVGLGFHPYLAAPGERVDECILTVPAATVLDVDDRALPTGRRDVEGTDLDFRTARTVGDQRLDTPYSDLGRSGGRATVELAGPDGRVALWADEGFGYLQVFTGDTVPQPERRRLGLAVEPMTCPANAFNSGDGLLTLEPGAMFTASWGITP